MKEEMISIIFSLTCTGMMYFYLLLIQKRDRIHYYYYIQK